MTRTALAAALLLALTVSVALAAPDDDARRQAAREYAEALQDYQRTGVDTSLADAQTDFAALDGLNPLTYHPLAEMPWLADRGYLLTAPGAYELDAPTFCLHAGVHGPGGGDGYALAPLRGIAAGLIHTVLERWRSHPEIEQHDVQVILWALVDRVSPDAIGEGPGASAQVLLTADELAAWRQQARPEDPPTAPGEYDRAELERVAGQLGVRVPVSPDELRDRLEDLTKKERVAGMLPGAAGRIRDQIAAVRAQLERAEALANNPSALAGAVVGPVLSETGLSYGEIESRLVLAGDPTPPPDSRAVPLARWSLSIAGGVFIRTIPTGGYARGLVQVLSPARYTLERDAQGRIVSVALPGRGTVELTYDGEPAAVRDHKNLRTTTLTEVRFSPLSGRAHTWKGKTVVAIGEPAAKGGSKDKTLADRIEEARGLRQRVFDATLSALPADPARAPLAWKGDFDALDLASLTEAWLTIAKVTLPQSPLELRDTPPAGSDLACAWVLYEALARAVRDQVDAQLGIEPLEVSLHGQPDFLALADWDDFGSGPAFPSKRGGGSVSPSRNVAAPGNTGRQREATAERENGNAQSKQDNKKGRDSVEAMENFISGARKVLGPAGTVLTIPVLIAEKLVDWMLDMGDAISDALQGDPPRDDFASLELPPAVVLPAFESPEGSSPTRDLAWREVLDSLAAWVSDGRSATVCLDRMGGAALAGDDVWVWRQARGLTHLKRQIGFDRLRLADALERYAQVLEAENTELADSEATADQWAAAEDEAARILGLTAEELAALRARPEPEGATPEWDDAVRDLVAGLRAQGAYWSRLPDVAYPSAPGMPVTLVSP